MGAAHDLVLVGPGQRVIAAWAQVGGALLDPSRAGHPAGSEAATVGLQAVGAIEGDGVVADGIVGGVRIVEGSGAKIVSGIDDHSRFVVSARVVARATARPVCDALTLAMGAHGVPSQILTDNGKVFTARFGEWRFPIGSFHPLAP